MINDLELDILKCEGEWALESITTNKTSGGDGIVTLLAFALIHFVLQDQICLLASYFCIPVSYRKGHLFWGIGNISSAFMAE